MFFKLINLRAFNRKLISQSFQFWCHASINSTCVIINAVQESGAGWRDWSRPIQRTLSFFLSLYFIFSFQTWKKRLWFSWTKWLLNTLSDNIWSLHLIDHIGTQVFFEGVQIVGQVQWHQITRYRCVRAHDNNMHWIMCWACGVIMSHEDGFVFRKGNIVFWFRFYPVSWWKFWLLQFMRIP